MLLDDFRERLSRVLGPARYEHSLNVMEKAAELALHWGADEQKAMTAGLLHDAARDIPLEEMLRECQLAGIGLGGLERSAPVLLHAPLGAHLLRKDWGIDDEEILRAVSEHTLGKPAMSDLSRIVYLADMTEKNRRFEGVEEVRRLALEDLDKAMALSLELIIGWLKRKEAAIHPLSLAAYRYYRERANSIKEAKKLNVKKMEPRAVLQKCATFAGEKKATGLVSMELTKISSICDYFLLCTASNVKQAQSVCDNIKEKMDELGEPPARIEGYRQGRWILLDLGSVIVHIFQQEEREYYNLERLWGDAPVERF